MVAGLFSRLERLRNRLRVTAITKEAGALAGHVSHAEEQVFVPDKEVVQVSSHFLRGNQHRRHIQVFPFREGGEDLGNHGHLDVVGNLELALHLFLTLVQGLVFELVPCYGAQDEDDHENTQDLQQHHPLANALELAEDFFVGDHDGKGPAGAGNRGEENVMDQALGTDFHAAALSGKHGVV